MSGTTLLNIMDNYFSIFHRDRTCNLYQQKKKDSEAWVRGMSRVRISAHLLSPLQHFGLFNKVPHFIAILFLNWARTLMPLLASISGRKKTNVTTVRIFIFLSTKVLITCMTKGLRNIYSLKMSKHFRQLQHHSWQEQKLIQIISVLTIQLKLSSGLVSATYGS